MKLVFIFPGQGAQYPAMGKDFVQNYKEAKIVFEQADDILKRKISDVILFGSDELLKETKNSQIAIFVVSYAILQVINKLFPEISPIVTSGLSLGEYTALTCAGFTTFEDGLNLVNYRGSFMNDCCMQNKGTMAAILGLSVDEIDLMVKEINLPDDLWLANYNCPGQVVISGSFKGVKIGSKEALNRGAKRTLPLNVHGAFHSGLMQSAKEQLREHVYNTDLRKNLCPIVMNVTGAITEDEQEIKNNLIEQITGSVKWQQGIEYIENNLGPDLYIEIGPGKTLSGFNKRIGTKAKTVSIEKVDDLIYLENEVKSCKNY